MAGMPVSPLTEEQYLHLEREAEMKSEFHDGQIFAMSGGSLNHSLLTTRMIALLDRQTPPGCRSFNSDLRLKVAAVGLYTYPDWGMFCGKPQFVGDQRDVILNPLLIGEVLSPSTEGYDRGKKFELYRTIATFREYLIIHQDRPHVEHYSKQDDNSWVLRDYAELNDVLTIARLNIQIPVTDLYSAAIND
jgi:Uma2 family endonuclease